MDQPSNPSDPRIRPFQPGDLPALKSITREAFRGVSIDYWIEQRWGRLGGTGWADRKERHMDEDVSAPGARALVAEEADGAIVGYVTARLDREARLGWIPNLAVRADHRGRGLGRRLLEAACAMLRAEGMEWAKIETLEANARGAQLYPSLGFEEICRQIHYLKRL